MSTDGSIEGYSTDALTQAESLDEDNLRVDPLEGGVEPPEHWAAADRFGTTPAEQRAGEDHDHRLAAEVPDVLELGRQGADTPDEELSERIDERTDDLDQVAPPEPEDTVRSDAALRGQSADEAGGSVASSLREG